MKRCFSTKGAHYDSPGQRPGFVGAEELRALKGRHKVRFAPSGLGMFLAVEPRTLSWAIKLRPLGALCALFPIKAGNFGGLGYGR